MHLEHIVTKQGRLSRIYPKFDPNTIQLSSEIMNDRRTNEELRKKKFWTSDYALYTVEQGEPILYLGGRDTRLILGNLKAELEQSVLTGNYRPNDKDIRSVLDSAKTGKTLRLNLYGLKLEISDRCKVDSCLNIKTSNYEILNTAQRALAEKAFGQGNDFKENMNMLAKNGIPTVSIRLLPPGYVIENVEEGSTIARVCKLDSFTLNSNFVANSYANGYGDECLRGVTKGRALFNKICSYLKSSSNK